jgi:alkylated DNA repair protein (DNA oxidative demethylase)
MMPLELGNDQRIGDGAWLLPGFALDEAPALLLAIEQVAAQAPFRNMVTPWGQSMSVAMTNCGAFGWVTDRQGYRYTERDPVSGEPWPPMPAPFLTLAQRAAAHCGYGDFDPDVCLINLYVPGARMGAHQDRDEGNLAAPIVSVSLGLPATFLWGGKQRSDKARRFRLEHGDVVVWGGPSRLTYHGVAPLADGQDPATGARRYNLTFRRAR